MNDLGRRELLTGLAATAAIGLAPILPASAAPLVRAGTIFRRGEYARGWSEAIVQTAIRSRWHFQKWGLHERTICHCDTDFMFATELRRTDGVELIRAADAPPLPVDETTLDLIGHAAQLATVFAAMAGWHRENDEGREGAFIYSYRSDRLCLYVTEDAPPLPRFG
jgi:hypothetical protein